MRLTVADRRGARAAQLATLNSGEYLARANPRPPAGAATAPASQPQASPPEPPTSTSTLLSAAAPLDDPVQPRPWQALAAGALLGLLAAAATLTVLVRPRWLTGSAHRWD
jgi:hypothetical protein